MMLTIVVPAYNEEEALPATLRACLAAVPEIKRLAGLDDVEIILVSDGSTDRTGAIAKATAGIQVIEFPQNRGYGAALVAGFEEGHGELLGFLDADGTCDPRFFAPLCNAILKDGYEIVLGSRLHAASKMTRMRRVGNRVFAAILSVFSGTLLSDTASGMRVMKRTSVEQLYPLPTGLDFTPAMSARAILSGVRTHELPMPYEDRVGQSKLRVLRDGVGFLRSIFSGVICFRPERLLQFGAWLCFLVALVLGAYPLEFWARQKHVEEWMIYRSVGAFLFGVVGLQLFIALGVVREMWKIGPTRRMSQSIWGPALDLFFSRRAAVLLSLGCFVIATAISWQGFKQYATNGKVYLHWSAVLATALLYTQAAQILTGRLMIEVVSRWNGLAGEARRREARDL